MKARFVLAAALLMLLCGGTAFAATAEWSVDSLGIKWQFVEETKVLTILAVAPGSIAEAQGLKEGDVVEKINDIAPDGMAQLNELLKAGATVKFTVKRGDWTKEISLQVPEGPKPPEEKPEGAPQGASELDKAKELLRKSGFTDEQIKILTTMFVLKIKEEAAPEKTAIQDEFVRAMMKADMPQDKAEALAKIFKFNEAATPAEPNPETKPAEVKPEAEPQNPPPQPALLPIEQAMKDALARGVSQDAIQALIILGRTSNWDDAKIAQEINKMTPQSKPSDYQAEKKPVEVPPAIQAAIKQVCEKTGTPEELIKGTVEDMLRAGRSETDIMKYLQSLMPPEPAPAPSNP